MQINTLSHIHFIADHSSPPFPLLFLAPVSGQGWEGLERGWGSGLAQPCEGTQPKISTRPSLLFLCLQFKHSLFIPGVNTSQVYHLCFLEMDIHFGKQEEEQHSARVSSQFAAIHCTGPCFQTTRLLLCGEKPVVIASSSLVR